MRPFLISFDLPAAPAEDAFKGAARKFNVAFSSLPQDAIIQPAAEVFLVLREVRGTSNKDVQITYDSAKRVLGIDCPLRVHVLEDGAASITESLAITIIRALRAAGTFCTRRQIEVEFDNIIGTIRSVVQAERGSTDA